MKMVFLFGEDSISTKGGKRSVISTFGPVLIFRHFVRLTYYFYTVVVVAKTDISSANFGTLFTHSHSTIIRTLLS